MRHNDECERIDSMGRAVLIALSIASVAGAACAQDAIDPVKASAFDIKMFGRPPGDKAYACFVRRYDADHMAHHPKQRVAAMKLLVSAVIPDGENDLVYSFRLGVNYAHRADDFDSSGYCAHAFAENRGDEIRFSCAVDCGGGASTSRYPGTTNPLSFAWSGSRSGKTTNPTPTRAKPWSRARTTGFSGSTAPTPANALPWSPIGPNWQHSGTSDRA